MLQCVSVCCSDTLQQFTTHCNTLQHIALVYGGVWLVKVMRRRGRERTTETERERECVIKVMRRRGREGKRTRERERETKTSR